ncbi:DUF3990 domain-containing protein [Paenibacillus urinalis]|uniref:DUF3990 domain-containing protein n=1 Tax=Paenibacillus urinalis TaxID=521520 RepID=A0AAX3MYI2_9BACL|nr:DUF3990 domain-containing protein [Paenibacillus urinalis]WDH82423.1 DUF3990 domain-containing protein [Paenibacillus urinalis]WDH98482.1 DUF3990 domain-containing protein [Paenibacillus urinalis]WDI02171.1 DUF3990 domain-containing protein [Paenibacillus urinalis]
MANYITSLRLPDVVYHGTTMGAIPSLKRQLINFQFLRKSRDRDFGTGFYTTLDLNQAMKWHFNKLSKKIKRGEEINTDEIPAVVKIRLHPNRYNDDISVLDFRGEGMDWIKFLLSHRLESSLDHCTCLEDFGHPHPQIVCGSMADNDTGPVLLEFKMSGRSKNIPEDVLWFADQITRDENGKRLFGLELGDQIVFFDERLNKMLTVEGYYKFNVELFSGILNREEWTFYDPDDKPASDE